LALRHDQGWTYPRAVVEALDAVDDVPLPARWSCWAVPQVVADEVVVRVERRSTYRKVEESLIAHGVPLQSLHLVYSPQRLRHPFPLRCDLRELDFAPPKARRSHSHEALLRAKE